MLVKSLLHYDSLPKKRSSSHPANKRIVYMQFLSQLADQDKFYNEENTHSTVTFEAIYKNCPFYKHFVERPSPQMKKIFIELVKAMTRGQNKANAAKM